MGLLLMFSATTTTTTTTTTAATTTASTTTTTDRSSITHNTTKPTTFRPILFIAPFVLRLIRLLEIKLYFDLLPESAVAKEANAP